MLQDFINDLDIDIMNGLLNTIFHDLEGKIKNQQINTETKLKEKLTPTHVTSICKKSEKNSIRQSKPLSHQLIPIAASILKPQSVSHKHIATHSDRKVHFSEQNAPAGRHFSHKIKQFVHQQLLKEGDNSSKNSIQFCDDHPSQFASFGDRGRQKSKHHLKQEKSPHHNQRSSLNLQENQNHQSQSQRCTHLNHTRQRIFSQDYKQQCSQFGY